MMIHSHTDNLVISRSFDPTHTTSLRNAFARDMRKRFNELMKVVVISVVDNDCFGLTDRIATFQMIPTGEGAFSFPRSSGKIEAFMEWLRQQVERGILTIGQFYQIGEAIEEAWTNMYVFDSYKRGIARARSEMIRAGMSIPSIIDSGGIEAVLAGTPFHMDRVGILYSRVFNALKGITSDMDRVISQILAQGMIDGDGPALIARKLVAAIDGQGLGSLGIFDSLGRFIPAKVRAEILTRTEIIRAHHLATIQEYRNWGVLGITVKAEWSTAKDDRVCEQCASLEGQVFELDEVESMIPVHPQCRCLALPWVEELQKYR